jgi:hypothetical protein
MLPDPREFADGEAVTLTLGTLTLVGSVVRGGSFADGAEVMLRAGRSGWAKSVKPRSYRTNSLKLSNALRDLATEVGETWRAGFGPSFLDRTLGYALIRRGGQHASEALAQVLGARWHVDELGETVAGDRPAGRSLARALEYMAASRTVDLSVDGVLPRPGQTMVVEGEDQVIDRLVVSVGDDSSVVGYLR